MRRSGRCRGPEAEGVKAPGGTRSEMPASFSMYKHVRMDCVSSCLKSSKRRKQKKARRQEETKVFEIVLYVAFRLSSEEEEEEQSSMSFICSSLGSLRKSCWERFSTRKKKERKGLVPHVDTGLTSIADGRVYSDSLSISRGAWTDPLV